MALPSKPALANQVALLKRTRPSAARAASLKNSIRVRRRWVTVTRRWAEEVSSEAQAHWIRGRTRNKGIARYSDKRRYILSQAWSVPLGESQYRNLRNS